MDLGLTQRTLADLLGCSYPTVASWESDACEPLAKQWPAIEAALGSGLVPERVGLPGRIRTARLRLGLNQEELAKRAGVDRPQCRNGSLHTQPRHSREAEGGTRGVSLTRAQTEQPVTLPPCLGH